MRAALALILVLAACHGDTAMMPSPIVKPAVEPERTAAADGDMRLMLAEVATAKACKMVRGAFLPLPDIATPSTYAGVLWLRDCRVQRHGTTITFQLAGDGWQWIDQQVDKAGGTFAVKQYVSFHISAKIAGTLDIAYAPSDHVVSLWFTPKGAPDVTFAPVGDIHVDTKGAWSWVLGALGTAIGRAPSDEAGAQARDTGSVQFQAQLGEGFSATIDLCSGRARMGLGRPARGEMAAAQPGESKRVPVLLEPGGMMISGPYGATDGMTIDADVPTGAVHLAVMCHDQADALARAFVAGEPPPAIEVLAERTVSGHGKIVARGASCRVAVVATPVPGSAPLTFTWLRPPRQAADSFGGPVVDCDK